MTTHDGTTPGLSTRCVHAGEMLDELPAALTDRTKIVFFETPTNPALDVIDIRAVAEVARAAGALTVVDNTFATPVNQNPLVEELSGQGCNGPGHFLRPTLQRRSTQRGEEAEGMARRKRGGAGDALDKAVGRLTETAGTASGDKTLEAEGRATQRIGERKTYVVTTHADGGWKVQVEGSRRATSVHKTKGEAVANAKELARSHQPSQLLVYKQNGTVQTEQTYG